MNVRGNLVRPGVHGGTGGEPLRSKTNVARDGGQIAAPHTGMGG